MPAWGPQPHQIGTLALSLGNGSAASQLITILKPGTTSWTVPKTSKYTFHLWGAGGAPVSAGAGAGGYCRKTAVLAKGLVLTCASDTGGYFSPSGDLREPAVTTIISGGGLSLSAGYGNRQTGGAASGGDLNVAGANSVGVVGGGAGGDGTVIGTGGLGGAQGFPGLHPGGGSGASGGTISASGEIRIMDETP